MEDKILNKKYDLVMEVLTPLHVGAGAEKDWMKGSDFIDDEGKVKVLNINKVATVIGVENLINALLKKDDKFLKNKLAGNLNDCVEKEFKVNYSGSNDIKTFIKNGLTNKPIVPGSSVKGALRSIVLDSIFTRKEIQGAVNNGKLNESILFGQADKGDELFRFVKISDASFQETTLCNTKVFNLSSIEESGWKHGNFTNDDYKPGGFNTFYEVLPSNSKSIISINFAEIAFNNFSENIRRFSREKEAFIESSIQDFFKMINHHTKSYLEKEKAFFEKYDQAENTDKILESIENLLELINQAGDKYCVLKMAAGSGFHSITGDWQFDDYSLDKLFYKEEKFGKLKTVSRGMLKDKKSAKSRKIAILEGKFELMGFVKLSLASDEDILKHEAAVNKSMEILKSDLLEKEKAKVELVQQLEAQKQEEEQKKAGEEQRFAEEQAKLEAERIAKIEAQRLAEAERVEKERLEREASEALLLRKEEDLVKSQEANRLMKESVLAEVLSKGLVDLSGLNDFENGKKIIEGFFKANNSSLITESPQIEMLKQFVAACIGKNNKRWKKAGKQDWVLVAKWVGKEMAQQWYNSLILK